MIELVVDSLLAVLVIYLVIGIVFSMYFYTVGAKAMDKGYQETPWHFKCIIFPGVVLFWVVLLKRIIKPND